MSESLDQKQSQLRTEWKTPSINTARHKYSREELLHLYMPQEAPIFSVPSEKISSLLVSSGELPVFTFDTPFRHSLGQGVNSRRPFSKKERPEKLPEWWSEEPTEVLTEVPKPLPVRPTPVKKKEVESSPSKEKEPAKIQIIDKSKVKNLPQNLQNADEQFSSIDLQMEQKLKMELPPEDEEIPQWDEPDANEDPNLATLGPVRYIPYFLDTESKKGNPFAQVIIENSKFDNTGALCPIPYSKPFEKVWHYKDPQGKVQGPFSSIQMFNWMAAGYFKNELEIAHSNTTYFAPLYMYVMQTKGSQRVGEPDPEATNALKSLLGLGSGNF